MWQTSFPCDSISLTSRELQFDIDIPFTRWLNSRLCIHKWNSTWHHIEGIEMSCTQLKFAGPNVNTKMGARAWFINLLNASANIALESPEIAVIKDDYAIRNTKARGTGKAGHSTHVQIVPGPFWVQLKHIRLALFFCIFRMRITNFFCCLAFCDAILKQAGQSTCTEGIVVQCVQHTHNKWETMMLVPIRVMF